MITTQSFILQQYYSLMEDDYLSSRILLNEIYKKNIWIVAKIDVTTSIE